MAYKMDLFMVNQKVNLYMRISGKGGLIYVNFPKSFTTTLKIYGVCFSMEQENCFEHFELAAACMFLGLGIILHSTSLPHSFYNIV